VLSQPMDTNLGEADLLRSMVQRNQWKEQREAIARSVNQKHQQYQQNYEKAVGELKAKAAETVSKRVPGWNDALWTSIREHAKADGYTDSELNSIADPRHQITLWKAQQYDSLKAKAAPSVAAVKNVKTTPANPMPQHVKDKLAFNKQLAKTTDLGARSKLAEVRLGALFRK
jgi:recombination DNA repair RAD52 pathway protein